MPKPFKIEASEPFGQVHPTHVKHQALLLSQLSLAIRAKCECGAVLTVTLEEAMRCALNDPQSVEAQQRWWKAMTA